MGTTPVYGLPYQGINDAPHGPNLGQQLAEKVETELSRVDARAGEGYRFSQTVYFTASGSFVKANYSGLKAVRVRLVGGGGGGGGVAATGASTLAESAGGGAGGYCEKWILAANLATSEAVTVGAGGAGGASGNNVGSDGGASSFGTHMTGNGGGGGGGSAAGTNEAASVGPGGGTSGTPDIAITGGGGGAGRVVPTSTSGTTIRQNRGAASFLSTEVSNTAATSAGNPGRNYGGGATGARNSVSNSAQPGPVGAPGIVIVEVYV